MRGGGTCLVGGPPRAAPAAKHVAGGMLAAGATRHWGWACPTPTPSRSSATRYFALCFHLLMLTMVEGFGGPAAVLRALKDTPMVISTGPCCCCCPCCPRITMTKYAAHEPGQDGPVLRASQWQL